MQNRWLSPRMKIRPPEIDGDGIDQNCDGDDLTWFTLGFDTLASGGGDDSITGGEDVGDGDTDVLDYSNEAAGVIVTLAYLAEDIDKP